MGVVIPTENKENRLGAVGNLEIKLWDKVDVKSFLEYSNGKSFGNYLRSENLLKLEPIKGYILDAHVNFQSAIPSFNYLINPSFIKILIIIFPMLKTKVLQKLVVKLI